ncbi:hypothetical protein LIER_19328 [Lithospermum erythrorhizon]|uniref:TLDc domain-containing protein n=1 Tax=Lithospermum erythrorhizon TaxID=34254 RepID=A0AAV3QKB5_LITER
MYSLKERISEKLSNLFSDSPSHVIDQPNQESLFSKEGRSLSSISPHVPLSFNKHPSVDLTDDKKTVDSKYFFWRSKSFPLREKPLENDYENDKGVAHEEIRITGQPGQAKKEVFHDCQENGQSESEKSNGSGFEGLMEVPDSQSFRNYMHNLMEESVFMTGELYDFFESCLPNIVKGCQWVSLYSTVTHGISLRTLIRKSSELSGPCLLIAGDKKGAIFGGLLECPLRPTAKRKYQGTNQTFVFTTLHGEPRLYRPTGANRYYIMCLNNLLALGGGSNFAFSMEEDLLCGTSGPCDTFGNLCLAHDEEFELKDVELWGFKHVSRYLS